MTFILRPGQTDKRDACIHSLFANCESYWNCGKAVVVTVEEWKPKRSLPQNNRLWMLHTLTARHLNRVLFETFTDVQDPLLLIAMRDPWTPERVHSEIYKKQFLNGESSTRRTKMQTVDDQTAYEAWMAEIGIEFPEAERYG